MSELKSRSHSIGQNCYHFIWSPKYRIPMFKPVNFKNELERIFNEICEDYNLILHEKYILKDHIHMFIELPPSISVSKAFQLLKGITSRRLRRKFEFFRKFKCVWSKGKFYRSVGNVTADVIEHYISQCQGNYDHFNYRRKYKIPQQTKLVV